MRAAGVFAFYVILAAWYTWPLLEHAGSRIASDPGDPVLNAAILWWNATTLPFSSDWWNAPHYYPSLGISAFTENLVGLTVLSSPTYWVTGNPILAYNVVFFLTWPLSAFTAYLLVLHVTGRDAAAFVAGAAYGFSPYRIVELPHIQILASFWLPLILLGLHRFLDDGRRRWLWLFGAAWILQALSNLYFMIFGAVLVGLWLAYFGSRRRMWPRVGAILAAWALSSLVLAPIVYQYRVVHSVFGLRRTIHEALFYSATTHAWLEASHLLWFWRTWLSPGMGNLFPGVTGVVLVLAALALCVRELEPPASRARRVVWLGLAAVTAVSVFAIAVVLYGGPWSVTIAGFLLRMRNLNRALWLVVLCGVPWLLMTRQTREALERRSPFAFYIAAAVVMAMLCLGPVGRAADQSILDPAPYAWLMALPGFDGLRVPTRFWMLGVLCLSVAAGLAFDRLRPLGPSLGRVALAVATGGVLLDGWIGGMPTVEPPDIWGRVEPKGRAEPILELPLGPEWDWAATFRAAGHRRRVVNGVSGYDPPHYAALVAGLRSRDAATLTALASLGPLDVVVNGAGDPKGGWARYVADAPGASLLGHDGRRSLYRIPRGAPEPVLGPALPIVGASASRHDARGVHDGHVETGWGEQPQQPGQWVTVDLGRAHEVGGVTHALGEYSLHYPRRLAIEVSVDGSDWEQVWEGPTFAAAFLAAARQPRVAAMRFAFDARPARFVRLQQLGESDDGIMWRVSEIDVHAPVGR